MVKKQKNFLITGFGRSGTKFLSSIMNRSVKWDIRHEPRGVNDEDQYFRGSDLPDNIVEAFDRDYYGEVNSHLRYFAPRMNVAELGVIIRNPHDIFLSTMNRKKPYRDMVHDIFYAYNHFLDLTIFRKVHIIEFEMMTTNAGYLERILRIFGIDDVEIADADVYKRINQNKITKYEEYDSLPRKWRARFEEHEWSRLVEAIRYHGVSL